MRAAEVEAVKEVAYFDGEDADPVGHKLDLYLPRGFTGFPVLVFVQGGSWRNGSKEKFEQPGRTPNYRLTPQVRYPGHIQAIVPVLGRQKTPCP